MALVAREKRSSREPGWYVEPGSISSVESYWDSSGPTDAVRFPDPTRIGEQPRGELPDVPPWDKHPYRVGSAKWWLTCIPWVGSLFVPDYARGRREALARGEIRPWPLGWRIVSYAIAFCFLAFMVIRVWSRRSS